ncbi:MAG: hypothetical protein ACOC6H_04055 [Thermoproteota archaeon]
MKRNKPTYVLDATAAIHFAKVGMLNLIVEICEAYITEEVYRESVERGHNHPDALIIKDTVRTGNLKVHTVDDQKLLADLLRHNEIHRGEAETITAVKELKGTAVMDEKEARVISDFYKVKNAPGCLFLLFRLLKLDKITPKEAEETLEKLLNSGLYLDPLTLTQSRRKLTKHQKTEKPT